MKCAICGVEVETIEEAIEQYWIPSFFDSNTDQEHEPACAECAGLFLPYGPDGEWEVKAEYRGKFTHLDGDSGQSHPDDLPVEIWVREENQPSRTETHPTDRNFQ